MVHQLVQNDVFSITRTQFRVKVEYNGKRLILLHERNIEKQIINKVVRL